MTKVYVIRNEDGSPVKVCSNLRRVKEFCETHHWREWNEIIEFEVDGEEWGTRISLDEIYED